MLVAPNTPDERIAEISKLAVDLIYCVAILGITGSGKAEKNELKSYLTRVEKNSSCPFVVGFGIKQRSDVIEINKMAHGAVIGSAIINEMKNNNNPIETVKIFVQKLTKGNK